MANENFVVRHGLTVCGNAGIDSNLGVSGTLCVKGVATLCSDLNIGNGRITVSTDNEPHIQIKGAGPNIIRFHDTESTSTTNALDLVYRTSPNTLGFEKSSDGTKIWESDYDNLRTTFHENVTISKNLGVRGNTSLDGTLDVSGNTDLDGTLDVSGNTSIGGALTVTNATDLNSTLDVCGNSSLGGTLYVSGNTDLNGTLDVSGNTSIGGTLEVTNATDLNGTLDVCGNSSLGGTLYVSGNTDLNGTLDVSGNTSIGGTLEVTNATDLNGTLDVSGNTSIGGALEVTNATDLNGTLDVCGNTSLGGTLTVTNNTDLNGTLSVCGNTSIGGVLTVTNNTDLNSRLDVCGNTSLGGTLTVTNNTDLNGTLSVCGNTSIGGVLTVTNNTDLNGTLSVCGNTSIGGALTVTNNTDLNSRLDVCGNTSLGGTLYVSGNTTLGGTLSVCGNTTIVSGSLIQFQTACGNVRGYIQATETNNQHFIIATSGGEDIAFKDGGTGGTTNMVVRGDGNVAVTANLSAASGTFTGTVSCENVTTSTLTVKKTATISADTQVKTRLTVGSGHIGSRNPGFSVIGDSNSSPIVSKVSDKNTTFSVLPWSSGQTYIASGTYYDDGAWIHSSDNAYNCLFVISGTNGARWNASSNSSGSWNVASNKSLWNNSGQWNGQLSTNVTYNGNTIWHSGNDGPGSTLDADTLDQQEGSYYRNATNINAGTLSDSRLPSTMSAKTFTGNVRIDNDADLRVGDGAANERILIQKADNNVSDHIIFYNGTTRIGEIGCEDNTWLRINQETAKNIYTPRYIRADGGFFVDGTSKGINGSGNFIGGTIAGASDYGTLLRSNANDTATGTLTLRDVVIQAGYTLQRSNHNSGHLEGSYNNVGANSYKSNPIYSIGSNYNPADASLSNFYGIGYSHTNASFISFTGASGWGMYVAADGDARIFLGGSNGVISSTGNHYVGSNRVLHTGDEGSGNGIDADTVDGIQGASFLRSDATDTSSRRISFRANATSNWDTIATASGSQGSIEVYNTGAGNDAFMSFHTGGDFAIYFGLDADTNDLSVGGWSMGANKYRVWHAGNDGSGSGLDADNLDGKTWNSSGKDLRGTEIYADNWFRNYNSGEGIYNQTTQMHWYSDANWRWRLYGTGTSAAILFTTNGNAVRGYLYADTASSIGFLNTGGQWGLRYLSNDGNSPNLYFREESNETWTGNPGSDMGKIEYHSNRFYIASGSNSTEVVRFRRSGTDVARIDNSGNIYATSSGYRCLTTADEGSGKGIDADTVDGIQGASLLRSDTSDTMNGNLTVTGTASFGGKVDFQGDAAIEGGSGYGLFKGYTSNNNHLITSRGIITGSTSSPTITGGHETTLVEYCNSDSSGFYFKRSDTGTYLEIARITRTGMLLGGKTVWHAGNDGSGSGLDADLLDGLQLHTGRNNSANRVVRTDSNGYIQAGWINTTSGNATTNIPDRFYGSYDGYIRYYNRGYTQMYLQNTYKYTTPRRQYTTDANYWVGTMGWGTTDFNTVITWGSGFIDSWSTPGSRPSSAYSHFVGHQALHYTNGSTNGTGAYGYQMVCGGGTNAPIYVRTTWNGMGSWRAFAQYGLNSATSSLYATIYYDSNNTGYYGNFASTSRMNQVQANNYYSPYVSANSGLTRSSYPYGFGFQESGGWTSPYPDLVLQYHTGVTMAANPSYNGITFKNDYNSDTVRFRINGGSSYTYKYTWMYTNSTGYYSGDYSWHISPNDRSSYGSMRLRGSKNGWYGMCIDTGNRPHVMFDGSGNGGFYNQDGGRWSFYYSHGNNCVGMVGSSTSSSYGLYVSKGIYALGTIYAASDVRVKKDIKTIENALDKVLNLRGVSFIKTNRSDDDPNRGKTEIGVIAQEVEEVVPEVVNYAEDVDEYAVSYGNLAGLFIEALKDQTKIINNLRQEVSDLKKRLGE